MTSAPDLAQAITLCCPYCNSVNTASSVTCWVCHQPLDANPIIMAKLVEEPERGFLTAQWIQVGAAVASLVLIGLIVVSGIAFEFDEQWAIWGGVLGICAIIAAIATVITGFSSPHLRRSTGSLIISVLGVFLVAILFVVAVLIALLVACLSAMSPTSFR